VPKLVWRVKLVAELRPGVMTESEVARIERDEEAGVADLGLRLTETKQLTAALQAKIVPAQVAVMGERPRCCPSCGHKLASKGHYPALVHSAGPGRDDPNPKLLCDDRVATDGIRASGRQHSVQDRHANRSLTLLGSEAAGAQPRPDQRLVAAHCRFY
jgi:hypothetical protein